MRIRSIAIVAACLAVLTPARGVVGAAGRQGESNRPAAPAARRAMLNQYCVTCHNARTKTAGLTLDTLDLANVGRDAATWEKVVRKLRTRTMPPQGVRRPDEATYQRADRVARDARSIARRRPRPIPAGRSLHRLNRAEYANAIRDLLALEVDAGDAAAAGRFGLRLRQHRRRARRVAVAAGAVSVGRRKDQRAGRRRSRARPRSPRPTASARISRRISTSKACRSGPSAARSCATRSRSTASTICKIRLFRTNFGNLRGLEHPHAVEIDRRRRARAPRDHRRRRRLRRGVREADRHGGRDRRALRGPRAGESRTARRRRQLRREPALAGTTRLQPFLRSSADTLDWTGRPHLDRLTITGPFNATGPGDTPSRRRIFACRPSRADATASDEPAAPSRFIATLARRAYRRPVTRRRPSAGRWTSTGRCGARARSSAAFRRRFS